MYNLQVGFSNSFILYFIISNANLHFNKSCVLAGLPWRGSRQGASIVKTAEKQLLVLFDQLILGRELISYGHR